MMCNGYDRAAPLERSQSDKTMRESSFEQPHDKSTNGKPNDGSANYDTRSQPYEEEGRQLRILWRDRFGVVR